MGIIWLERNFNPGKIEPQIAEWKEESSISGESEGGVVYFTID